MKFGGSDRPVILDPSGESKQHHPIYGDRRQERPAELMGVVFGVISEIKERRRLGCIPSHLYLFISRKHVFFFLFCPFLEGTSGEGGGWFMQSERVNP